MLCIACEKESEFYAPLPVVYAPILSFIIGPRLEHVWKQFQTIAMYTEVIKCLSSAREFFVFS